MKVLSRLGIAASAAWLGSCAPNTEPPPNQTLLASEDASFICASVAADGRLSGRPIGECPDTQGSGNALYALLTQPETGEVALLSMAACADGAGCRASVSDLELTQPGVNFLPVGAEPSSIVSTPGGQASFVGVREPGREGLYALPTSCIGPRTDDQSMRDLRTWPACRLPAAPGAMALVVDTERNDACDGSQTPVLADAECPADLSLEGPGRRELVVAMPSLGQVWTIDAQALVNRAPGSFDACPVDAVLPLSTARPATIEQQVPAEFVGANSCGQVGTQYPSVDADFQAVPADLAVADDRLYIADIGAPVVHVVDLTNTCGLRELDPLLPVAFTQPGLVVTTRKLAVSPLSQKNERFVYAIDDSAGPLGGSVMVFDVSKEDSPRTPLVRERSTLISVEPPDRIRFTEEAADVEFAWHEQTAGVTGTGELEGVRCDPGPDPEQPQAAWYRPTAEGAGARPLNLRGLFGFIVLKSGWLAVVDVEDLDAECRRSAFVNPGDTPDARGCANDPWSSKLETGKGAAKVLTVTNENSCHIIEPHRVRSNSLFSHETGGTAPTLRANPQLRSDLGASLATDVSPVGVKHPKLLGMPNGPILDDEDPLTETVIASVYVGTTEYKTNSEKGIGEQELVLDPAAAERSSVLLPETEPRAYVGNGGNFAAVYEGPVRAGLTAQVSAVVAADLTRAKGLLQDQYASFSMAENSQYCFMGVEDEVAMAERGLGLLPWSGGATPTSAEDLNGADRERLAAFASEHADYVSVTSDLLPAADAYWSKAGAQCGAGYLIEDPKREKPSLVPGELGRRACELTFGPASYFAGRNLRRDFRIVRAFNDELVVEPRLLDGISADELAASRTRRLDALACCFPTTAQFEVRASQQWLYFDGGVIPNAVRPDPETLACERRTCDPLLAARDGRVFEVTCNPTGEKDKDGEEWTCARIGIGQASADISPCILPSTHEGALLPGELPAGCYADTLTARFAVYRGQEPTARGMAYTWATSGGFSPMLLNTDNNRGTTSPRRLQYVPEVNRLVISDGGSRGITFMGLRRDDGSAGFSAGGVQ